MNWSTLWAGGPMNWLRVHLWWPVYRQSILRWRKRHWPVIGMVIDPTTDTTSEGSSR